MAGDLKHIILPDWLDKIIFDTFEAVYEPRPLEVVYNPDQSFDFVKLYLGTYFPRSYAESYSIVSSLFQNNKYKNELFKQKEINVLDFCCGTGGEIVGLLVALNEFSPNIERVYIDAFDASPDAIFFLFHLIEEIERTKQLTFEVTINPQTIFVETEQEIKDIVNITNVQYQFMMSFKAINEFVQHKTFSENAYKLIASHLFPLLAPNGVFILSDVTTKTDDEYIFYPQLMNTGLNKFVKETSKYKTIIPFSCYHYETKCPGCYMQDTFFVSHREKKNDISKVAYRIVCNTKFADDIMDGINPRQCRATNPQADKNIPYQNGIR